MLTKYALKMPLAVYSGEDALENMKDILKDNNVRKAAIFSDKTVEQTGLLELAAGVVREAGVDSVIINDLPPEPSYEQVQSVADRFKASGADFIIAVGGGSVIDSAKLASVVAAGSRTVKDLLDDPKKAHKRVKTLMIPTTAGTGAEATPNAIVLVPEKELKVGVVSDAMIADYVILDARMVRTLPRPIAAATGIDALAHAIECFTSKKANPFSDIFALQALEMIFGHIEEACNNPDAIHAKNQMQLASFYAGVAITASGTTAVHALSYPLGGKYHIAHGVANSVLLAPVMAFNEPCCKEKFAQVYDRCVKGGNEKPMEEKSRYILEKMSSIVKALDIPTNLSSLGVPQEDLEDLVSAGMQVTRLLVNNMREVTENDAREIYKQLF